MKILYITLLGLIGALALAGTAYAQVPASNDTSDGSAGNTGMGTGALGGPAATNGGGYNTASGYDALFSNTTGGYNTASGFMALYNNTYGLNNTASGYAALYSNTTGTHNTASGFEALYANTFGTFNTASGDSALTKDTTGYDNTASGAGALFSNTTGSENTASGLDALANNTTGNDNTAFGDQALYHTTGSNNIAVGFVAGATLTTGSHNIDIGSEGVAAESNVIRIGTKGVQTETFIAGIYNHPLTGNTVVVTAAGRLGVQAVSSERFKTAIEPMGLNTAKLEELRPVTFHLKTDPKGALQYGLIAEEVAKVYPELVIRGEKGRIDGVRYDELAPMLLNEMQKRNAAQDAKIGDLERQVAELTDLKQELHAALIKLQAKEELVAQR